MPAIIADVIIVTRHIFKYRQSRTGIEIKKQLRSGHTERGLPQRTADSVRCGRLSNCITYDCIIPVKQNADCRSGPV